MFGISCCGFTHNHVPLSSVLLYLVRFSLSWGGGNRNSSWMRLCASVGQCWLSFLWDVRLISGCRWCQPVHYKFSINPVPNGFTIHLGSFSSVQSLSRVQLFSTPWITARQASLSITNSQSLLKIMSIESVMPYNHFILCHPVPFSSCLQPLPASGSFQLSQFFASGGQRIGVSASASVLTMNNQDWFPLG